MAAITSKIELELAGRGNGWTDITADVLTPIRLAYGIQGAGPSDRTASSGSLTCSLNNSAANSAKTLGYWSAGGPAARAGWSVGIRLRAQFYDPASATWYTKFVGSVTDIAPDAGVYGSRRVRVVAADWMDEAARATIAGLTTQINKRSDEVMSSLIGNVSRAPVASSLGVGRSTFAYALDNARDDRTNPVLQEIARVTASELGYSYVKGDGTFVFEPRFARVNTSAAATLSDDMAGLSSSISRDSLVSKVQTVVHPRTVDVATVVLYRSQNAIEIPIGGTVQIVGGYTDPNNRANRVGGTSMVTPVATTDYLANAAADGSGTNLTASISVSATLSSNSAAFTITNNASVTAYVTKLQARGIGLYDYEQTIGEAVDATVETDVGEQVASLDMPYLSDVATGVNAARYLLQLYSPTEIGIWALGTAGRGELGSTTQLASRVLTAVGRVTVTPKTAALQTQILARDVGDRVSLTETVTGISNAFYIQAVDLTVNAPGIPVATWTLSPADTTVYWSLGTAGFGELGTATRLSF
jgi:hypothetical protein